MLVAVLPPPPPPPPPQDASRTANERITAAETVEQVCANGSFILAGDLPLVTSDCPGVAPGDWVAVGIRSEEVTIIRPGRPIGPDLQENLFEARVVDILGFGGTHTLTVAVADSEIHLDVVLPNCAFRDLGYANGDRLRIALRRRSLWALPLDSSTREVDNAQL